MLGRTSTLTLSAFLALSFACSEAPPSGEVQFRGLPIINGSAPDDPRYDAVVGFYIYEQTGTYICSGTLISPSVIVTAAHCLDVAKGGRNFQTAAPSQIEVFFDDTIAGTGTGVAASETLIHSGYNRRSFGVHDLGLIRLAQPATGITPIAVLPAAMASFETTGTSINFAGYGKTETGSIGSLLQVDGTLSAVRATQLEYQQATNVGGPCGGDSGGPLFYDFGGTWYVGGTTSYGDSACASYGVSMRTSSYETWIRDFVGTVCTTAADCDDGNACTTESCNAGSCSSTPIDCSDGNACTDDVCIAGACSNPTIDCNDGNACTDDSCDPSSGCLATNNSNGCNDGDACTNNDVCSGGACGGTLICEPPPPPPACFPKGDSCSDASDCCSGKCRGGACR